MRRWEDEPQDEPVSMIDDMPPWFSVMLALLFAVGFLLSHVLRG